jgi:hydroxymethylglutaryl-CoA lyase
MSQHVRITDVSPRDGLQNEPRAIPTADKAALVRGLLACGLDEIEVTSFVSPRWIPQLGDANELLELVAAMHTARRPALSALVPNEKGLEAALRVLDRLGPAAISKIAVFTAASETFSKRNTNASIAESLARLAPVIARARQAGLPVRGYVSCVISCPFEGEVSPTVVASVAKQLTDLGVDEIDLGDTIGTGTPDSVATVHQHTISALGSPWSQPGRVTWHLHDTHGRAAACVERLLSLGCRSFDGSVAGLGGCPYASTPERRAPGNIATEAIVGSVMQAGLSTSVDPDALRAAAELARAVIAGDHPA